MSAVRDALARKHLEQKNRMFPNNKDLPEELADLKAEWADFDGFIAGLVQRILAGEELRREQVEPSQPGHEDLWKRLHDLEQRYPDSAPAVVREFRFLEEVLDLLRVCTSK